MNNKKKLTKMGKIKQMPKTKGNNQINKKIYK